MKYNINKDYFNNIDNEEKSYWLGFLYADGYVRIIKGNSGELKLKLKRTDKNHIELFRKHIGSTHKIIDSISKVVVSGRTYESDCSSLSVYNTQMVMDLMKHGCGNNKTFKIRLPKLRKDLIRHFIRGYFDGDGCINKVKNRENTYSVSLVGNEKFIGDISTYLNTIDTYNKIYKIGKIFKLTINKRYDISKIKYLMYNESNVFLERKKDIFDEISNFKYYDFLNYNDAKTFVEKNDISSSYEYKKRRNEFKHQL